MTAPVKLHTCDVCGVEYVGHACPRCGTDVARGVRPWPADEYEHLIAAQARAAVEQGPPEAERPAA